MKTERKIKRKEGDKIPRRNKMRFKREKEKKNIKIEGR